jgi:hypothetical protein
MKKSLLVASLLAVALSACSKDPNEPIVQDVLQGKSNEAKFVKYGTFRNCEVGDLSWYKPNGSSVYLATMNVVICPDKAVTNEAYREGKTDVYKATIGKPMSDEEFKAIQFARQRKEALDKLSDSDRKALGLNEDK